MQIIVRDNNVEQALRALKKKLQREGVYREMKLRRHYEKPSEKRARERAAAIRRARKLERKRAEREGSPNQTGAKPVRSRATHRPAKPAGPSACGWRSSSSSRLPSVSPGTEPDRFGPKSQPAVSSSALQGWHR